MVLIGQRMPTVLMLLGLALTALLLKRLRLVVVGALLAGALMVAALPAISPVTYDKLVLRFSQQMEHFPQSAYGRLYIHAAAMAQQHPWSGLGFEGFRRACHAMEVARAAAQPGVPAVKMDAGMDGCSIHPHNYYLEAADAAGVPGLLAFAAMVLAALAPLARGLWRQPEPLRVGLFVGAVVALWPIASTSAFTSMPNSGWVFLLLGFGLAVAPPVHAGSGRRTSL
jgi:O-antigen ligase